VQTADGKPVTTFKVSAWRPQRQWEARNQSVIHEEGKFSMAGKPGTMMCLVTASGLTQGQPMEVTVGASAPEVVITMGRAAILTGTVRDTAGSPLAGATVSLGNRNEERGRWDGGESQGSSVTTDSLGRYRFETLEAKTHTVTARFGEFSNSQTVDAKEGDNTLDFSLDGGARVVLKLTGATGEPVSADEVWFQGKGGNWPRPSRLPVKEPGRVEFAGLKPGEYTATITSAGWPALRKAITVKEGENTFEYQFAQGATLSGTVLGSSGAAVPGVGIRLRKDEEDAYGGWGTGRYAQVAADGKYKLGPAEPGIWKLEVYATEGWKMVHSSVVNLAVGENTQNVTVDSAGTVVATVTDEAGVALAWAEVQLRGEQSYNGRTDQSGKAVISFVAPGTYQVYASSRQLSTKTYVLIVNNGENPVALQLSKANSSRVTHVYPDTQAAKLGMQVGDLVFEYNGEQITSWRGFGQAIRKTKATDDVILLLERNGQILTFNLKGGTVGIEGADGVR
jgi:protocatechuate 3,4-dioxygenase beta subunit